MIDELEQSTAVNSRSPNGSCSASATLDPHVLDDCREVDGPTDHLGGQIDADDGGRHVGGSSRSRAGSASDVEQSILGGEFERVERAPLNGVPPSRREAALVASGPAVEPASGRKPSSTSWRVYAPSDQRSVETCTPADPKETTMSPCWSVRQICAPVAATRAGWREPDGRSGSAPRISRATSRTTAWKNVGQRRGRAVVRHLEDVGVEVAWLESSSTCCAGCSGSPPNSTESSPA